MLSLVAKLREVKKEIDAERGGIVLLALFEREDASGKLDILFSAAWISRGKEERPALEYFTEKLQPLLTDRELLATSTVLVFQPDEQFVQLVLDFLREMGNPPQFANERFNGMLITNATIIAADLSYSSLPEVSDFEAMQKETAAALDAMAYPSTGSTQAAAPRGRSGRATARGRKSQAQ